MDLLKLTLKRTDNKVGKYRVYDILGNDVPDVEARQKIIELNLDIPLAKDFNFSQVAESTEGFSGADMRLLCDEAKRMMFRQEISGDATMISTNTILTILDRIRPSVDEKMLRKFDQFTQNV